MLIKYSISNAKKFFKNTLQSFKSFLSGGYQKLPKTPPFNPFSCSTGVGDSKMNQSFRDLDNFYTDFTSRWDFENDKPKKNKKKAAKEKDPILDEDMMCSTGSFLKFSKQSPLERIRDDEKKVRSTVRESESAEHQCPALILKKKESGSGLMVRERCSSKAVKEERNYLVTHRLKELELVDISNVDHVLDIEEVLHYYSRLTCPAYLDMVDRFFMQIYSEFFLSKSSINGK